MLFGRKKIQVALTFLEVRACSWPWCWLLTLCLRWPRPPQRLCLTCSREALTAVFFFISRFILASHYPPPSHTHTRSPSLLNKMESYALKTVRAHTQRRQGQYRKYCGFSSLMCVCVYLMVRGGCETVAETVKWVRELAGRASDREHHPSKGMNKKLFINTPPGIS